MTERKLTRRKFLELAAGTATGALLAACQSQPEVETVEKIETVEVEKKVIETVIVEKEGEKVVETVEVEVTPPPAPAKPIELWTGFERGVTATGIAFFLALDRFNDLNPQWKVETTTIPWGDLHNKVLLAVAAGDPPDLFRGWSFILGDDAADGVIQPIDDFIDDTADFDIDDIWSPIQEQMKYAGKNYGIPYSGMVNVYIVNRDVMRTVGLDLENLPKTLEEVDALGDNLTEVASGGSVDRLGFCPWIPRYDPFSWYGVWGGESIDLWNPDTQEVAFNNEAMINVCEWFKSYADKYGVDELQAFFTTYGGDQFGRFTADGAFYTGKVATWMWWNWGLSNIKDLAPGTDYAWYGVPTPKDIANGKPGSLQSNMYLIPNGSQNPEGGFAFGHYMNSDIYVNITKTAANFEVPARKSNSENPDFQVVAPYITEQLDIAARALPEPSMPKIFFCQDELQAALQRVIFEGTAPEESLATAVVNVQREIDRVLK